MNTQLRPILCASTLWTASPFSFASAPPRRPSSTVYRSMTRARLPSQDVVVYLCGQPDTTSSRFTLILSAAIRLILRFLLAAFPSAVIPTMLTFRRSSSLRLSTISATPCAPVRLMKSGHNPTFSLYQLFRVMLEQQLQGQGASASGPRHQATEGRRRKRLVPLFG